MTRALVDGRAYLGAGHRAGRGGGGDAVLFAGYRADADQLLHDDGPPVAAALAGAASRGAVVRV